MIRCIQVGRSTIQGRVIATYPDPSGEHGAIRSMGRVVIGRLTPGRPHPDECPSCHAIGLLDDADDGGDKCRACGWMERGMR